MCSWERARWAGAGGSRGGDGQEPGEQAQRGRAEPQAQVRSAGNGNMKGFEAEGHHVIWFANILERSGLLAEDGVEDERRGRRGEAEEEDLSPGPERGGEDNQAGGCGRGEGPGGRSLCWRLHGEQGLLAFREKRGEKRAFLAQK